jgi:hypothetical protein
MRCSRLLSFHVAWLVAASILVFFCIRPAELSSKQYARADQPAKQAEYVGSQACAKCHRSVYDSFSRTDMGRSMVEVTPSFLEKIPNTATVSYPSSRRRFEVSVRDRKFYQTEYEVTADGKEIFRNTHELKWVVGAGANGFGAILRRGNFLFEAPLSFYAKTKSWALSPGYEFADYGFNRPILPGCITCHSGQPRAVLDGNGLFRDPPFTELAIGCENCHGPGESHVIEMQISPPTGADSSSIVNPSKLPSWLADNICMSCHQTGDARVLTRGKDYRDFRPGAPLDETMAILMVPPSRERPPESDLLEHYFSMMMSKCYRSSNGKLGCISCHDPHVQPSREEAPAYFRLKCLTCHTEKSCALPVSIRQRRNPPDDCGGCHMPKREVQVISHSVLTNHRIVAETGEPFPDAAFHMTTPQLPDLIHLSAVPGKQNAVPPPLVLLEAYGQVRASHPDYRERYWDLAKRLEGEHSGNVAVLEALADWASQQKTREGDATATEMRYLELAINRGATSPVDFEELGRLLLAAGRSSDAAGVLQQGLRVMPYDAELYRLLVPSYFAMGKKSEGCGILTKAGELFPEDAVVRSLSKQCETTQLKDSGGEK